MESRLSGLTPKQRADFRNRDVGMCGSFTIAAGVFRGRECRHAAAGARWEGGGALEKAYWLGQVGLETGRRTGRES